MKEKVIAISLAASAVIGSIMLIVAPTPALAINHHYRDQLIRSGCTEINAGHGCDINKTKAQNQKLSTKYTSTDADIVINADIDHAADYLLSKGWKPNNGDWHKDGKILRLVVENGKVVNAQVM